MHLQAVAYKNLHIFGMGNHQPMTLVIIISCESLISSVLYQKMKRNVAEKSFDFHFNTFSVNFREELTGFYGGTLQQQTRFVATAVEKILSFYPAGEKARTRRHLDKN